MQRILGIGADSVAHSEAFKIFLRIFVIMAFDLLLPLTTLQRQRQVRFTGLILVSIYASEVASYHTF